MKNRMNWNWNWTAVALAAAWLALKGPQVDWTSWGLVAFAALCLAAKALGEVMTATDAQK